LGAPPTDHERTLSAALDDDWARFAATGDPGGVPAWPAYDPPDERYLQIDVPLALAAAYHVPQCAYLDMQPHL
jgi:carboxylesterase type B